MKKKHELKEGTLAERIRQRSIIKRNTYRSKRVQLAPGTGRAGSRVTVGKDSSVVVATRTLPGLSVDLNRQLFYEACNDVLCMGGIPMGYIHNLVGDPGYSEESLRELAKNMGEMAQKCDMDYLGGDVMVASEAGDGCSTLVVMGKIVTEQCINNQSLKPGMDLVMTKFVGIAGTVWLTEHDWQEKLQRLPDDMVQRAREFGNDINGHAEAQVAWEAGVTAMHHTTQRGIFGDLWAFAEASGVGLTVDLKVIPIRQETIEICEAYDLNPYMIPAGGAFLIGTYDGKELVKKMQKQGCMATVIGKITEGAQRVVVHGEEERALLPHNNEIEGNIYRACRKDVI